MVIDPNPIKMYNVPQFPSSSHFRNDFASETNSFGKRADQTGPIRLDGLDRYIDEFSVTRRERKEDGEKKRNGASHPVRSVCAEGLVTSKIK